MKTTIMLSSVLINLFIAFMGIGLVIPVLPALINELGLSGSAAANLVAAFALTQLIASPIAGKWTDKYGRKRMIVIGLILFSLSELLFGLAQSISLLFASRLLGGISAAFIMPAVTAFIADITTNERALKLMANVAQLGKDLDLTVTAEGVETEEQLTTLAELTHIDQVQGFLFGVPLPAAEVRKLIHSLSGNPAKPVVARA